MFTTGTAKQTSENKRQLQQQKSTKRHRQTDRQTDT